MNPYEYPLGSWKSLLAHQQVFMSPTSPSLAFMNTINDKVPIGALTGPLQILIYMSMNPNKLSMSTLWIPESQPVSPCKPLMSHRELLQTPMSNYEQRCQAITSPCEWPVRLPMSSRMKFSISPPHSLVTQSWLIDAPTIASQIMDMQQPNLHKIPHHPVQKVCAPENRQINCL